MFCETTKSIHCTRFHELVRFEGVNSVFIQKTPSVADESPMPPARTP